MYLSRRLMFTLFAAVAVVWAVFNFYQAETEMRILRDQVERQARVLAESQRRAVLLALQGGAPGGLQAFVDQFRGHDQLKGVVVYGATGRALAFTRGWELPLTAPPPNVTRALRDGHGYGGPFSLHGKPLYVFALPLNADGQLLGAVALFQDTSTFVPTVWRHASLSGAEALAIFGITLLIIQWSLGKPVSRMTEWLRDLRAGAATASQPPKDAIFHPLAKEITRLAASLHMARAAAAEEARLRDAALSQWTAERLRVSIQSVLNGSRLFSVSNREPYEHLREGNSIRWSVPPSGLVTALDPVMCASDGVWIAQGTGDADRESADEWGRLRVPPDHPQYGLRRVWLTKEEEDGFYFGFANEGIWPLCHIAHTRPVFRTEDWEHYRAVNAKFAAVLLDEMHGEKEPLVLVQDYHFALLPRMVKERRPDARVAIFWHIPWPNPEAFGICPWQRELLDGMLGADLAGFHIQAHCNNFLETVDRSLESCIDWEYFAVNRRDHLTGVRPFPISVIFNGADGTPVEPNSSTVIRELGVRPALLGLGVDRIDYTKGIPERLRAVERLLDLHPEYRERFTLVQIGAPSRTHIKRYQDLIAEVEEEAERINRRFATANWKPIVFLKKQYSHAGVQSCYREADVCLVTALHDGMNLVAKEYVAAREDEQGVLVLSRFAGASHELKDALLVNPYDTDELARAIHTALRMRVVVREHNVYRWAGRLIGELAGIRPESAPKIRKEPHMQHWVPPHARKDIA